MSILRNGRWMVGLVLAGALLATSGCRGGAQRRRDRDGRAPGDLAGLEDFDIHGRPLGPRMDGMLEVDERFEAVLFALDSSQVQPEQREHVERVARYLRTNPNMHLIVEGHCCDLGSREYNLGLGERRALAVRAYLVSLQIAPDRIQTTSYGQERPLAPGRDEASRRLNRRAEFVILQ